MSSKLKLYLQAEHGRARRLAESLGVTESHISNVASGKKAASAKLLRGIAELTGIGAGELVGAEMPQGLADQATPYTARPFQVGQTLDAYLAPKTRHRATFVASVAAPWLGILKGDILVIDMRNPARAGDTVLAAVMDGDFRETRILRYIPPFLSSGAPTEPLIAETDVRIQGAIVALARGPGL